MRIFVCLMLCVLSCCLVDVYDDVWLGFGGNEGCFVVVDKNNGEFGEILRFIVFFEVWIFVVGEGFL